MTAAVPATAMRKGIETGPSDIHPLPRNLRSSRRPEMGWERLGGWSTYRAVMPKAMTIIPSVAMNGGTRSFATTTPLMAAEERGDRDGDRDGQDEWQLRHVRVELARIRLRLEHRGRDDGGQADHATAREVHAPGDEHDARAQRDQDARGGVDEDVLEVSDGDEVGVVDRDADDEHHQHDEDDVGA